MPTYDYRCNSCGATCELFQSITDKPKRKCPTCSRNTLKRLIGPGAGIIFKGSGFYETDYRSPSYNAQAKKEKDAAAGKDRSTSTKDGADKKKKDSGKGGKLKAAS